MICVRTNLIVHYASSWQKAKLVLRDNYRSDENETKKYLRA